MSRLLEWAAQGERASQAGCSAIPYFKNEFLHQSELVAPNVTRAQFVFHHSSIPVIEHGEHHEIQFM
jgi:hypothetical protein